MRTFLFLFVLLLPAAAGALVPLPTRPTWQASEAQWFGTGLDVGDVDGNGWLDLAVSNGNDMSRAPNFVYRNQGGVLPVSASWTSSDLRYSGHCQFADIDHDGYPELMVANYVGSNLGPAQVQVYDNVNGVLEVWPGWESPVDMHSFRASFGDPDGDGDLDLAVATGDAYNGYLEQDRIFFNEGGRLAATPGWLAAGADVSYDIRFVDIDGDGDQDLATLGGGYYGRIKIYFNEGGTIATTPGWISAADDDGNSFDFDDLDGDGRLDLVAGFIAQLGGSGRFAAFLTAGGSLPTTPTWTSAYQGLASAVVCCDLDGVGGPDLVAGGWWEPVRVYLNNGAGAFPAEPDWQTDWLWRTVVEQICFVDLDEGRTRPATAAFPAGARLLRLPARHLQAVGPVTAGGDTLPAAGWCSSLRDGWVSLAAPASGPVSVAYRVSDAPDMAISNWDKGTYVFHSQAPAAVGGDLPALALTDLRAWPNPFNPATVLSFRLGVAAPAATVRIYDLRGRLVEALHSGPLAAGPHAFAWRPRGIPGGAYLCRVEAGAEAASAKLMLAR